MPKDYEEKKAELRRKHPSWSLAKVKEAAAKAVNAERKRQGRPAAKFHRKHKGKRR